MQRSAQAGVTKWLANLLTLALLLCATLLFRLPALLNTPAAHADATIIGLQAMHLLRGEWAWFIWGTNYQGFPDVAIVALCFALGGSTPQMLMLAPLLGHLLLISLTFATVRRHLPLMLAALVTLPVVFTPQAVNGVALYAPRQWSITCVIAAIWLLDTASGSTRPAWRYAVGAFLAVISLYLDFFVVQFLPALALFACACCFAGGQLWRPVARRLLAAASGAVVAFGLLWLSRLAVVPVPNQVEGSNTDLSHLQQNARLLWDACLPWLLGYGVYINGPHLYPDRWQPPLAFGVVQVLGAIIVIGGICSGGALLIWRKLPWRTRRLGALGCLGALTSLAGFIVSSNPIDLWATRYLAPIIWLAPFALVPVASLLGARWSWPLLTPYLMAAAVGGWLSFSPAVQGWRPVQTPAGRATAEAALGDTLRQAGVHYGIAEYWVAYRLTFLWQEAPIVVPTNPTTDRYAPYRQQFTDSRRIAYLFDRTDLRSSAPNCVAALQAQGLPYTTVTADPFTALIVDRGAGVPDPPGCVTAIPTASAARVKK